MTDDEKNLQAAFEWLGIQDSPATLVERWVARRRELRATTLLWDRRELSPGRELGSWYARHGKNQFRIDGLERDARLHYFWHGQGERVLGEGTLAELSDLALTLVRRGGPFGGPPPDGEQILERRVGEGERMFLCKDGELRLRKVQAALFVGHFLWPDGRFAFRLPSTAEAIKAAGKELMRAVPLTLAISGARVPWHHVDTLPWLGTIHAAPYDLMLSVAGPDQVAIVALVESQIFAVHVLLPEALPNFDAGRWFATLPPVPQTSRAPTGATPRASTADAAPGLDLQRDAGAVTSTLTSPPTPAKTRKKTPHKSPHRPASQLAELLRRHFAHVAAKLPAGVLGAATAHVLLQAIEDAYARDLPAISGSRTEVYSALHAAGVLRELPSEHAGRAALQLLSDLSPIVRRVHHRRWSLLLPELRDPTSNILRAIRKLEGEAG